MHEPLLDRIRDLERANRRWKTALIGSRRMCLAAMRAVASTMGVRGSMDTTSRDIHMLTILGRLASSESLEPKPGR